MKIYRSSPYLKTLSIEVNENVYALGNVVIHEKGEVLFLADPSRLFGNGFVMEDVEVTRRLKVETGFDKNDTAFIVKLSEIDRWSDVPIYDLYIDNDLMDFKIVDVVDDPIRSNFGYVTVYNSKRHDFNYDLYAPMKNDVVQQYNIEREKFQTLSEKRIFASDSLQSIKDHYNKLIEFAEDVDKLKTQALNDLNKLVETLKRVHGLEKE